MHMIDLEAGLAALRLLRPGYRRHDPDEAHRLAMHQLQHGDEECWGWLGSLNPGSGYPQIKVRRAGKTTTIYGHQFAYQLAHGPVPSGMVIRHLCGNRCCTNPAHLTVGTQAENAADSKRHGVITTRRLNDEEIATVIAMRRAGYTLAMIADEVGVSRQAVHRHITRAKRNAQAA
jgi:hypothetical protein